MPRVIAPDGARPHHRSTGSGRPLVLLHGWTMNGRFFDRNVDALAERHRVITVDLRGHGRSEAGRLPATMEQLARDLHALLTELGLRDVVLAGWSMGATVVYNYLDQFGSDRLAGIPAMFAAGFPPDPDTVEWWTDESLTVPDLTALALWASFGPQDWRPLLPRIDVPVLLAHGAQSQVYPTPVWEFMARQIPATSTALFENSGPAPFWEEPVRFNRAVTDFIARL